MNSLAKRWGEAVAERRTALGLTQKQLAELCDVEQQTISKIEKGGMHPTDRLKITVARNLRTTPGILFAWPPMAELVEGAA